MNRRSKLREAYQATLLMQDLDPSYAEEWLEISAETISKFKLASAQRRRNKKGTHPIHSASTTALE